MPVKPVKKDEALVQSLTVLKGQIPEKAWPAPLKSASGKLAGVRMGQRMVAHGLHDAGFRDMDLVRAVMVCGSESWLYTKARNDNLASAGFVPVGNKVRTVGKLELLTVTGHSNGKTTFVDSAGDERMLAAETSVITSRDVGLMEINISAEHVGEDTETMLYDPARNFATAFHLYESRGFQPWVGFTSEVYLHDTYLQWALMGVSNFYAEVLLGAAASSGYKSKTRLPWVGLTQLRQLYPDINLG